VREEGIFLGYIRYVMWGRIKRCASVEKKGQTTKSILDNVESDQRWKPGKMADDTTISG
jgi:hypothetical protein